MRSILPRVILGLAAVMFIVIGVWFMSDPSAVELIEVEAPTATAKTDVRAVYGGLDLAIGLYLAWCLASWRRTQQGLVLSTVAFACLLIGRVTGVILDGEQAPIFVNVLIVESLGFVLSAAALIAWRPADKP